MRVLIRSSVLLCAVAFALAPRLALAVPELAPLVYDGPADSKITVSMSNQIRGEFVNWWEAPPSANKASSYNFLGNRFKLGVGLSTEHVDVFAQFQHSLLAELPGPADGPGGVYFANTPETFQQSPILRNAWARVRGWGPFEGFSIMGGRMPYLDGMQAPAKNPALQWLLKSRIGQRLIGPFEYTMVGRSFDGGKVAWENEKVNATFFGFVPTQGGFEIDANPEITEINIGGASLNIRDSEELPNTLGRLFWFWYNDSRDIVVLDNRPLPEREATRGQRLRLNTVGGNILHVQPIGPGRADVLGWGVGQLGKWQDLDHVAWAYTLEAGYALPDVWGAPWLRTGITRGSGDSDPTDDRHNTFFQMLPTARIYAQTPFYNMMNNQDVFVQGLLKPHDTVSVMSELHWLRVNNSADIAYFGGGATSSTFFGYGGVPAKGRSELSYLVDVSVTWTPTRNIKMYAYYGHGFGQGIVNANFQTKDLDYAYIELILSL